MPFFSVGRDLGLVPQPPKGTGSGSNVLTLNFNQLYEHHDRTSTAPPRSVGSFIQGNLIIDTANGSSFLIGNNIINVMYIEGGIIGFSGLLINTDSTPMPPPFSTRLNGSGTQGFVVALQGESG